jgi:hypothetical protein
MSSHANHIRLLGGDRWLAVEMAELVGPRTDGQAAWDGIHQSF